MKIKNLRINMKACALFAAISLVVAHTDEYKTEQPIVLTETKSTKIETINYDKANTDISAIEHKTIEQNKEITISFAGDCTLGNDKKVSYFHDMVKTQNYDYSYFLKNVKPIFEIDDYTLVNLETTLTDATSYADKTFTFKGDFDYVNILKLGSVEGVNISNNHSKDYLEEGYQDTIDTLDNNNIDYSGDDYVHIEEVKGIRVGFIGFKNSNLNYQNIDDKLNKIKEQNPQLIIASCHWGVERENQFNASQQEIGHYLIDNGVDVVIGHHPHVLQGIEEYNGKYIVYSLGNFCFGGNSNPKDKDTMIFRETFKFDENNTLNGTSIEIIPCSISSVKDSNNFQPTPLDDTEKQRVIEKVKKYSYNFTY